MFENDLGAVHVGLDRIDGLLDDQLHADGRREMKDHVAAIDEFGEERLVVDRVDEVLEAGAALEVGDVVDRSGRQVVENQDLVPLLEQRIRQMGSDEPRAAGDQRSHS